MNLYLTQAELELVLVIAHGQMNMTTTLSNLSIATTTYQMKKITTFSNLSIATTTYQSLYTPITKVTNNLIDQILACPKI